MSEAEPPQTPDDPGERAKRKRPVLRWAVRLALVLLLVLIVVIIFLPGILSGGWARGRITEAINNRIEGAASIESISLSWFGEQRIEGLALRGPDGEEVASVESLTVSGSLWSLITGARDAGTIAARGLRGRYVAAEGGPSNVERAVEPARRPPRADPPDPRADEAFRLPAAFKLEVIDARFTVVQPDRPAMRLGVKALTVDASRPGEPITLKLDGGIERGDDRGKLTGDMAITGYRNDRTLAADVMQARGELALVGVPVEAVDAIGGLDGLAVAAVDGPIDLTFTADPLGDHDRPWGQRFTVHAAAPSIERFAFEAELTSPGKRRAGLFADQLALKGEAGVIARPQLIDWINRRSAQFNGRLVAGVPVTFTVHDASTPAGGFDPAATQLDAAVSLESGSLVDDPRIGDLSWGAAQATVQTDNLAKALRVELGETRLAVRGRSGRVSARAELAELFNKGGEPTFETMAVNGEARLVGLPMGLVDLLAGMDGLAVAAIAGPLDLDAEFAGTAGGEQTFTLTADAANIEAFTLNGARRGDRLSLDGEVKLTARPELAAWVAERTDQFNGRLDAGVPLTLTLANVRAAAGGFDPAATRFALTLATGAGALRGDRRLGDLAWQPVELRLATDNLAEALRVRLPKTPITVRGTSGHLLARFDLAELFDEAGTFRDEALTVEGRVEAVGLPPTVVDAIVGLDGWVAEAMDSVSVTAEVKGSAAAHIDADLELTDAANEQRKATLPLRIGKRITLQPDRSATLAYLPTEAIAAKWMPADLASGVRFGRPIDLAITALDAPGLGADMANLTPDQIRLAGKLTLREVGGTVMLEGEAGPTDKLAVPEAVVELGGESLAKPTFTLDALVDVTGAGAASTYLGGRTRFEATGSTTLDAQFAPGAARLDLRAENASGEPQPLERLAALIETDAKMQRVRLVGKGELKYRVGPAMIAAGEGAATLADPALATVTLDHLQAPLAADALGSFKAVGDVKLDDATLAGHPRLAGAKLVGLTGSVNADGPANTLAVDLAGRLHPAADHASPAPLTAKLDLRQWQRDGALALTQAAGEMTVELKGLAARDAEALAQATGMIEPFTGERLNLRLTATLDPATPAPFGVPLKTLDLALHSTKLDLTPGFRVGPGAITLLEPVNANLDLAPDDYARLINALSKSPQLKQWVLTEPARPRLTLKTLNLPLPASGDDMQVDLSQVALEASFDLPRLAARDRQRNVDSTFVDVRGQLTTEDPTKRLKLALTGKTLADAPDAGQPETAEDLNVEVDLIQLLDSAGRLTTQQMQALIEARLKALPVAMLDALTGSDGQLLAAFGEKATLTADARLERFTGPLNLNIDADHAVASLKGHVRNGVLHLKEPLTAEFTVTEALGRKLLKNVHPLLRSVYTGEQPIKLVVAPGPDGEGFALPLDAFDLTRTRIDHAELDLGKLKAKPGPLLRGLRQLAGRNDRGDASLWFSPLRFSMKDGRIAYQRRLDLLLDGGFHLATWGAVQLDRDNAPKLDLYFGFPAETLDKVFGLDDASSRDLFTVSLTGTADEPKVDFAKAAADMGRLQAQYKLIDNPLARAAIGKLINRLLRPEGEADPPRQSVSPLPWRQEGAGVDAAPDAGAGEAEEDGQARAAEEDESKEDQGRRPRLEDALDRIFR